ncbi:DNA-binding protein [Methylobacterium sp. Leaf456]|uniref:RNA-binding protein n=1 Tax=Methylobacterium sp. Leaf456 TaxID=1736382 RepID=UPI0006F6D9DD|nr:RNA-binding protein [Methylobacterium sp. Leaf456]KQT46790.1 DNA-binding protein [Methylobacterium sp. Leaf456]
MSESIDRQEAPEEALPLDRGPARGRDPLRTCIVTRLTQSPEAMIRFVLGPDGTVVPDLRARLPGRGAWVTANRETVAAAVKRRAFNRAFKTNGASAPPDLPERVAEGLRTDMRQALALANKAGCLVTGFGKVESAILGAESVAALIHASDAMPDGRRKLAAALRRRHGEAISAIPVIDDLSNVELDMALGRDHVIHAALVAGAGTTGYLARWRRFRAFEGVASASKVDAPPGAGATAFDSHDDVMTLTRPGAPAAGRADDGSPQGSD